MPRNKIPVHYFRHCPRPRKLLSFMSSTAIRSAKMEEIREKKPQVTTSTQQTASTSSDNGQQEDAATETPTAVRFKFSHLLHSWVGIISLFAMIACATASAIVIAVSHNATIDAWEIQPAVLLAIFSAVSNIAFTSALATGVTVRFWLSVSRGASLSQLHYIWEHGHGSGFFAGLRQGPQARRVVLLATLASTMQFVSGPLLQRSTHQISQDRITSEPMVLDLATTIPDGWLGNIDENGLVIGFRRGMVQTQRWWKNETMYTRNQTSYFCDGVCDGYVPGAGLMQTCWSTERHLDLATNETDFQTVFLTNTTLLFNNTATAAGEPETPIFRLTTEYLTHVDDKCMATIVVDTCDVVAAVVEYPITIQGSIVSLRRNELTRMKVVSKYISAGDLSSAPVGAGAGPLAGLQNFAGDYMQENATKRYNTILNRTLYFGPGYMADLFFLPDANQFYNRDNTSFTQRCQLKWTSPTEYLLNVLHEWMFRTALNVGSGNSTVITGNETSQRQEPQRFDATRTVPAIVFRADLRYLGAAIATTACGLLLVASLMWGWWRLNRRVTLSPLETANAFGAPVLRHVEPDANINQILKKARDVEFRAASSRPVVSRVTL
ncbi:hypothetical protein B0H66DRAFT_556378 [Apodospora peruviana]|uniref:Transmembrane protein n=1 Tax=Apodospora peruviana TaxID=516989 RepID=A0AAE0I4B8_9PEZI|nr:hypothetical protein B0H66DRAFT_556378 [Apodospora peruviana]